MNIALKNARTLLISAASAVILAVGITSPAQAHDELVSTTPTAEEQLTQAPEEVTMKFSGDIMTVDGANKIKVTDAEGQEVSTGDPAVNGQEVTQKINGHGDEDETYTVAWRVVSSDGHPIQGSYELTVGEGQSSDSASSADLTETPAADEKTEDSQGIAANPLNIVLFSLVGLAILAVIIVATIAKTRRLK